LTSRRDYEERLLELIKDTDGIKKIQDPITAIISGTPDVNVTDRAARLLGIIYGSQAQQLLQRVVTYDLIVQLRNAGVEIDPRDISDRATRLLGVVYGSQGYQLQQEATSKYLQEIPYGSQGQFLQQRATTYDLLIQLRNAGVEIDPRARTWNLGSSDIPDLMDKASRLLGIIYGDQGQLAQRAITKDAYVQLRSGGTEIDPRALTSLPLKGTPNRRYGTTSGEVVAAPGAGYKLRVYGFKLAAETDEISRLRYGGATGTIFAVLPAKGVAAMNLINVNEAGGDNQNIYLEKTGAGNALAIVWTESVAV